MHYYKFNIGDYASHTQHLEPLEDIAYRRMLDWLYLNEMHLPADVDDIARLIRMRTHSECIATVLREFFECSCDGYTHVRVERELASYQDRSNKAKKSAEARWKNKPPPAGDSSDANALRNECEGNAKHKPLTTNQEPLLNTCPSVDERAPPCPVEDIVSKYNEILVELPRVAKLTDSRKQLVRSRWRQDVEHQSIEFWGKFFEYIKTNNFLMGREASWQASFDWIMKQSNFIKIYEGNYDK